MVSATQSPRPVPAPPVLHRTAFTTSRALEFFTEKELAMQLGFAPSQWPLALLKELLDNALDACETAGVSPLITVDAADPHRLTVTDNGPGLPLATLERSLDYMVRISDKQYYVSPSRGQLGNALKCLWAAPYVLSRGRAGAVVVETAGQRYEVTIRLDPFAQVPEMTLTTQEGATIKTGTSITVCWPEEASYLHGDGEGDFYHPRRLVEGYALFNPHAHVRYQGTEPGEWPVRAQAWRKWVPSSPTSPHWYTVERFAQLIAAYIAEDRRTGMPRTVRDLLAEFDGLRGVQARRAVQEEAGLLRTTLEDLVCGTALDTHALTRLLHAMQARARPVKPDTLGVLGQPYLTAALTTATTVAAETLTYHCVKGTAEGLPYVLELACGWDATWGAPGRRLYGYNHAPALRAPFRSLDGYCQCADLEREDPVTFLVHLVCPRLDALDRGKTQVTLPTGLGQALGVATAKVTKRWTALKKKVRRLSRQQALQEDEDRRRQKPLSVKEAAYQVMEAAYRWASSDGTLPANARQIMYAARPDIIRLTGTPTPWKKSSYFTQVLLPDFMREHPDLTAAWDVVFDARGHFREPHTGEELGLGTVEVRQYLARWQRQVDPHLADIVLPYQIQTVGPWHRYHYALFVEKEGFDALLAQAALAERYDLALMSTKGMTVTAARQLVEQLSAAGVTILVLHDFDKSGLEILDKFTADTRRYQYTATPRVIDLGLRLAAALQMGLESEPVSYQSKVDPRLSLRSCGASEDECDFLVAPATPWAAERGEWRGQRIELNAMTSRQFLDWLEETLQAVGVEKVVPDAATLVRAYQHLTRVASLQALIDAAIAEPAPEAVVPGDLPEQIRARITATPTSWDRAVWEVVCDRET